MKVLRDGGEDLALSVMPEGRATLQLGAEDGKFIFSHGKGQLFTQSDEAGAAFEVSRVLLGNGRNRLGVPWPRFKLFLAEGERYAEVFLLLTPERLRGELREKWSEYRAPLASRSSRRRAGR